MSTPSVRKRKRVARAGDFLEAHLVTDGAADRFAELRGDEARGQAGGQAARFEHQHFAVVEREERGRNAGGLSRPGRASRTRLLAERR